MPRFHRRSNILQIPMQLGAITAALKKKSGSDHKLVDHLRPEPSQLGSTDAAQLRMQVINDP